MIKLWFSHRKFLEFPPPGTVLHLKIVSFTKEKGGAYSLEVEDVTPLPCADLTSYSCTGCGLIVQASPDGSLPKGWREQRFERGSYPYCPDCKNDRICRVCGCSDGHACEGGCYWVEEDLCSACATPKK